MSVLHNWIIVCSNAYVEYTFVSWQGTNVYRRTVDYRTVCVLQSVAQSIRSVEDLSERAILRCDGPKPGAD